MAYIILNSRKKKEIKNSILKQFGLREEPPELKDCILALNKKREKVYMVSGDIKELNLEEINISTLGVYLCTIEKDGIRMSIEGSQMIGPYAENTLTLSDEEAGKWVNGQNLLIEGLSSRINKRGYILIRHLSAEGKSDFLGCGKIAGGRIINYVPKERRIAEINP